MKQKPFVLLIFCFITVMGSRAEELQLHRTFIPEASAWAAAHPSIILPDREHPCLFLTAEQYQSVAARGQSPDNAWAHKQYSQILSRADATLSRPLVISDTPGEWNHHYVCKSCGVRLQHADNKNVCPRCAREYSGWPYDGVVAGLQHYHNVHDALHLGLAYQFTQREVYALRTRDILLGYADRYTSYPIHDFQGKQSQRGARLSAQTLDEAVRMIPLVWAYDLVHNSPALTSAHRRHIEENLFRPAARVIRRNDMGISNWQSWHNAAIAAIGFVLEDATMVSHAIHGKSGLLFQMEKSVLPDGFWYEGTASYHFYALMALQHQALAMKAAGINIFENPRFRALYETPLAYTFPDGRFPAVNDSDPISIYNQNFSYEVAYAIYGDPQFGRIAARGDRASMEAFLFGKDSVPTTVTAPIPSRVFPDLGAVMLRQETTSNPMVLHLDYGPHGGGHGHPDKLGIILYANGTDVMPDAGRLSYGAPLHRQWYTTTLAHNTVIVDGRNQKPTEGRLISSSLDGPIKLVTAACDTAYEDAELTRSVALAPEYLLDVVSGSSPRTRTWDLAYHVYGNPETSLTLQPATLPENQNGYQVLKNIRESKASGSNGQSPATDVWAMTFSEYEPSRPSMSLTQASLGDRHLILADGLAGSAVTTCPVVLSRKVMLAPTWVTLIAPDTSGPVAWEYTRTGSDWIITIKTTARTDTFLVTEGLIQMTSGRD